jgi:hypothetical protein
MSDFIALLAELKELKERAAAIQTPGTDLFNSNAVPSLKLSSKAHEPRPADNKTTGSATKGSTNRYFVSHQRELQKMESIVDWAKRRAPRLEGGAPSSPKTVAKNDGRRVDVGLRPSRIPKPSLRGVVNPTPGINKGQPSIDPEVAGSSKNKMDTKVDGGRVGGLRPSRIPRLSTRRS